MSADVTPVITCLGFQGIFIHFYLVNTPYRLRCRKHGVYKLLTPRSEWRHVNLSTEI
jgi:hypothetical protein